MSCRHKTKRISEVVCRGKVSLLFHMIYKETRVKISNYLTIKSHFWRYACTSWKGRNYVILPWHVSLKTHLQIFEGLISCNFCTRYKRDKNISGKVLPASNGSPQERTNAPSNRTQANGQLYNKPSLELRRPRQLLDATSRHLTKHNAQVTPNFNQSMFRWLPCLISIGITCILTREKARDSYRTSQ